jgi:hypothetical protein
MELVLGKLSSALLGFVLAKNKCSYSNTHYLHFTK